jgi:hypothetical protein
MSALPSTWGEVLKRCNFHLARRELGEYFKIANEDARGRGGEYIYKEEFVRGWDQFAENPCQETARRWVEAAPEYAPMMFSYFAGCCPGGIYHRTGMVTASTFSLGDYRLDMSLREIRGLRELTKDEYAVFGRESKQEVIYHAEPTEFVGYRWKMMVGAIEGRLYQLAATLQMRSEDFTINVTRNVFKHCELLLGTPSEEQQGRFIWDTSSGSVVFQHAIVQDTFEADVYVSNKGIQRYGRS